jgi:hypothetical protein
MVLGMSLTGVLAIIVIVLALIIILVGMSMRVKKLNVELAVKKDDNITPYLRTLMHYKRGSYDFDSKVNALTKVSKEFLKDYLKFNSEKTFDEIARLSKEEDVRNFCSSMSVIKYSKNLDRKNIDSLYLDFERILIRRVSKDQLKDINPSIIQHPLTVSDLTNRKMKRDIADIKGELSAMGKPQSQSFIAPQSKPSAPPSIQKTTIQTLPSTMSPVSVEERLAAITEDIDVHNKPGEAYESDYDEEQPSAQVQNLQQVVSRQPPVISQKPVDPNRVIREIVKGVPAEKIRPANSRAVAPVRESRSKKLSLKTVKIGSDPQELNREILTLNSRLQRLIDSETQKRLGEVESGNY